MKKIGKIVTSLALAVGLFASTGLIDNNHAFARGGGGSHSSFSGGSHSFSSSRSSFGSSSRSTSTRSSGSGWFGGSSKKSTTSTSKPKVNLNKSSTTSKKSTTSNVSTKRSTGTFSGASSKKATVRGRSYTGTSRTVSYHGTSIHVSHYYHVGYSPFGWFSYYHGFTYGMFMGSMFHPFGVVYPVGGHYVQYGASPISIVMDIIALLIILTIIFSIFWSLRPRKTVYKRRF